MIAIVGKYYVDGKLCILTEKIIIQETVCKPLLFGESPVSQQPKN